MLSVHDLRNLASEVFPNVHPRLVHLLSAWAVKDPDGELSQLLADTGLSVVAMAVALEPLLASPAKEDTDLLKSCIVTVREGPFVGRDLLRALCDAPEHRLSRALGTAGLELKKLGRLLDDQEAPPMGALARHGIAVDSRTNALLKFGRDLTALGNEGALDAYCDRPEEINRLLDVLLRKRKGNPILTGPAGVGKSALVELLARKLTRHQVSVEWTPLSRPITPENKIELAHALRAAVSGPRDPVTGLGEPLK